MKRFALILTPLQLFFSLAYAQPPVIQWQKCYGSGNYDGGYSIAPTSDGGSIFAGITYGNGGDVTGYHGSPTVGDYWITKLDNTGSIQWSTCLGSNAYEQAMVIRPGVDGSYVVAGMTSSSVVNGDVSTPGHGGKDFWVVKLSPTGNILWQQTVGGELDDYLTALQLTPDGGYILGGYTMSVSGNVSGNHGGQDGWVVKLSSTGSIDWQKCLGGSGADQLAGMQVVSDGYIVVGNTTSTNGDVSGNHGGQDGWVVKLNATGAVQWSNCFGGSGQDQAADVQKTADGGYLVVGNTASNDGNVSGNHGQTDFWAVKLDNAGVLQWQQCYGGSQDDHGLSAAVTADGSILIAGQTLSRDGQITCPTPLSSGWILKASATGVLQWQKTLGGNRDDVIQSIQLTADGGIIAVGNTASTDLPGYHSDQSPIIVGDIYVVKLLPGTAASTPTLTVAPPPNNICAGSPVTLTTTTNISSPVAYEWIRDGANISLNSPTYTATDFANGDPVYARIIYEGDCGVVTSLSSNIVTLDINPVARAVITIETPATTICSGSQLAFTSGVTGIVGTPVYQWLVNGNPAGSDIGDFIPTTLQNGDIVSCLYSDDATCMVPGGNISNTIAVTVNPVVTPALSIKASATTVCAGDPVSFTTTPVNGGVDPVYQWLVNGHPAGGGDASYNSSDLSDGDIVSCVMNNTALCSSPASVTSNTVPVKVNPLQPLSLSIDYVPSPVCSGDPVVFTARPAGAPGGLVYQWQLNGKPVGTDQPTYTNTSLANGDVIICGLSDPATACTLAGSFSVQPVVNPLPVVGVAPSITLPKGQNTLLQLPVSGDITTYSWMPVTALSDPAIANPLASPLQTTTYTLQVKTDAGCTAEGTVRITVYSQLAIPQAFSPNGDGHNDIFYVLGGPVGSIVRDFAIYNRWGGSIFQVHDVASDDPAVGWNGTMGGRPAETGIYVYMIRMEFADKTQQAFKGTVTLVR